MLLVIEFVKKVQADINNEEYNTKSYDIITDILEKDYSKLAIFLPYDHELYSELKNLCITLEAPVEKKKIEIPDNVAQTLGSRFAPPSPYIKTTPKKKIVTVKIPKNVADSFASRFAPPSPYIKTTPKKKIVTVKIPKNIEDNLASRFTPVKNHKSTIINQPPKTVLDSIKNMPSQSHNNNNTLDSTNVLLHKITNTIVELNNKHKEDILKLNKQSIVTSHNYMDFRRQIAALSVLMVHLS